MGEVAGEGCRVGGDNCVRPDPLLALCRHVRPPPSLPWLNASHLHRLQQGCSSWQTYQDLCVHGPYRESNQELLGGGTAGWIVPATAVTSLAVLALAVLCVYTCYRNIRGRTAMEPRLSTHLHRLTARGVRWLEGRQVALRSTPRRHPHPRPASTASKVGLLPTSPSLATVTSDKTGGHDSLERTDSLLRDGQANCRAGEREGVGKLGPLPAPPGLELELGTPFSTGVEMFSVLTPATSLPPDLFPSHVHGSHPVLDLPQPQTSQDCGDPRIHPSLPTLPRDTQGQDRWGPRPLAQNSWGKGRMAGYGLGRGGARPVGPRLGVGGSGFGRLYHVTPTLPRGVERRAMGDGGPGLTPGCRVYDVGYANPAYEGNEQLQRLRICCPECHQIRDQVMHNQACVTRENVRSLVSTFRDPGCGKFYAGNPRCWKLDAGNPGCRTLNAGNPVCRKLDAGDNYQELDPGDSSCRKLDAGNPSCRKLDAGNLSCRKLDAGNPSCRKLDAGSSDCRKLDAGDNYQELDPGDSSCRKVDAGNPCCRKLDSRDSYQKLDTDDNYQELDFVDPSNRKLDAENPGCRKPDSENGCLELDSGDSCRTLDSGDLSYRKLVAGDSYRKLDTGDSYRKLAAGDSYRKLNAGDSYRKLNAGDPDCTKEDAGHDDSGNDDCDEDYDDNDDSDDEYDDDDNHEPEQSS